MRSPWRLEAGALTALALPMIAGNIAWAGIAATDLLLLGRLGAGAVASGALAINLFNALLIFGMGLVTAAAPLSRIRIFDCGPWSLRWKYAAASPLMPPPTTTRS